MKICILSFYHGVRSLPRLRAERPEEGNSRSIFSRQTAKGPKKMVQQPKLKQLRNVPSPIFPDEEVDKVAEAEENEPECTFLRDSRWVPHKFLNYDPTDVASINDRLPS